MKHFVLTVAFVMLMSGCMSDNKLALEKEKLARPAANNVTVNVHEPVPVNQCNCKDCVK